MSTGRPRPRGSADADHGSRRLRPRDPLGKEALYSTSPTAGPTPAAELFCPRCGVRLALGVTDLLRLFRPPFLLDPVRRRLLTGCPACRRTTWLRLRGRRSLRTLLGR